MHIHNQTYLGNFCEVVDDFDEEWIDSLQKLSTEFVIILPSFHDALDCWRHREVGVEHRQPIGFAFFRFQHHIVKGEDSRDSTTQQLGVEKRLGQDVGWKVSVGALSWKLRGNDRECKTYNVDPNE